MPPIKLKYKLVSHPMFETINSCSNANKNISILSGVGELIRSAFQDSIEMKPVRTPKQIS